MMRHLPQTVLDHIRTELRNGGELSDLADLHNVDADYLRRLLDEPLSEREQLAADVIDLHAMCIPGPTIAGRLGLSVREVRHAIETGTLPRKQRQLTWT